MVDAAKASMMFGTEPEEVRISLGPSRYLFTISKVGEVDCECCKIDTVDDGELKKVMVQFESVSIVWLATDRASLSIKALIEAHSLSDIADGLRHVYRSVGIKGCIVRVILSRRVFGIGNVIMVRDLLGVRRRVHRSTV